MEILTSIITLTIFFAILASPVYILKKEKKDNLKFITYLLLSLITTLILGVFFAWWTDYSNNFLLAYYGYNFDGMCATEYYKNVSPEDLENVHEIERSIGGIGWPLKVIMMSPIFFIYCIAIYLVYPVIWKKKHTQKD